MAYQRVPETAEITVRFDIQNEDVSNLYYARYVGGYSQSDLNALAAAVDGIINPAYIPYLSQYDSYVRTDVRGLDSENDLTASAATPAAGGNMVSLPLPVSVSFCVQQNSGLTGRSARGRIYVPSVLRTQAQSSVDNQGLMNASDAANWVGTVEGIRIAISGVAGWTPVLVSRYHNGSKRSEAVTFVWTSSQYRTLKLASRRKRLR
jgi:hypothetical protein